MIFSNSLKHPRDLKEHAINLGKKWEANPPQSKLYTLYTDREIHKLYQLQSASLAQAQLGYLQQSWTHSQYILDSLPETRSTWVIESVGLHTTLQNKSQRKPDKRKKRKLQNHYQLWDIMPIYERDRKLYSRTYSQDSVTSRLDWYMEKWVYTWMPQHLCNFFQVL